MDDQDPLPPLPQTPDPCGALGDEATIDDTNPAMINMLYEPAIGYTKMEIS
jgi:hypothetical protein